jgi:putative endonuclease
MYNKFFKKDPTDKQKIGQVGEDFACKYLIQNKYNIVERNYLKKWGEIDIVAKKGSTLHFFEVKSVTRQLLDVTHETLDAFRPEDNMHKWKIERLNRAIQSYLIERNVSDETSWQLDLVTVYLDRDQRLLKIDTVEDIVL